jgi:hypothetical protein
VQPYALRCAPCAWPSYVANLPPRLHQPGGARHSLVWPPPVAARAAWVQASHDSPLTVACRLPFSSPALGGVHPFPRPRAGPPAPHMIRPRCASLRVAPARWPAHADAPLAARRARLLPQSGPWLLSISPFPAARTLPAACGARRQRTLGSAHAARGCPRLCPSGAGPTPGRHLTFPWHCDATRLRGRPPTTTPLAWFYTAPN